MRYHMKAAMHIQAYINGRSYATTVHLGN